MSVQIVIAGTGTDVGKTVFAAALVRALDGFYWKPIQAGLNGETDSQSVARLSGLDAARILPEAYRLSTPASPHVAAEIDHMEITISKLMPPRTQSALIIEPAGGLAVPITRKLLQIDLLAQWKLPVVLCAKTELGTINHSLLSIEALKRRAIPILGVAFVGDENVDSQRTICEMGGVRHLGRLPYIRPLTPDALHRAFALNFNVADILGLEASGP
ncbi:MAG: dethiobiotin synthase [Hyphomicrobium sp.]|nr:MAG: dethiobiotin synthase [Hyphomicrobium sp.]PPD00469.1 MAG: dethiobiotin synthase [Hyphomicrobium sp.]